jgi:succinate dehydrogenase hydrophobic anchor subunit
VRGRVSGCPIDDHERSEHVATARRIGGICQILAALIVVKRKALLCLSEGRAGSETWKYRDYPPRGRAHVSKLDIILGRISCYISMLRSITYGFLGLIVGAVIGLVIVGLALPSNGWVGLCCVCAPAIAFAFAGVRLSIWMNRRSENRLDAQDVPLSEAYVAAYISAIVTICYVLLLFVFITATGFLQGSIDDRIFEWIGENAFSPILLLANVAFYGLSSQIGVWYVSHARHLGPAHSSAKISLYAMLLILIPTFYGWRALLAFAVENPVSLILPIALGILLFFAVKHPIDRAQGNMSQQPQA